MQSMKSYISWVKKLNEYFEKKLQEVKNDDMQLAAYNSLDNTVVIAGPGSGKTTVLTLKVMQLLEQYITEPRGLACLTYSTEATREFKDRLKKMGLQKRKNVFLGTVHSFCLSEIIIPFSMLYPEYKIPLPIRIISEKEKNKLFAEQQYEGNPKLVDVDKERTRNIRGISRVALESYDIALKAAIHFEELLFEKGYVDFISMIKLSVEMISNEAYIRKTIEAKYPWIIVDEYQDLGRPLHEIILTLLNSTKIKVFAVGDSDQSIYGFQGADPGYLLELSEREDVERILLKNNYRSSQTIVDASQYVLNRTRGYIASGELKDYDADLEFFECSYGMNEQYEKTIELINDFHKNGVPYHEIAVLVGSNNNVACLSELCSSNNIPTYTSRQIFRTTDLIVWLQMCARWVIDRENSSFDDICFVWKSFISHKYLLDEDEFLSIRKNIYRVLSNSIVYKNNLSAWLSYIYENIDIRSIFAHSEKYPDEIDNLKKLKDFLDDETTPLSIKYLARLGTPENQVVLSTRHSSKGLEFDVVVMLGMEKDSFPSYYDNTEKKLEEARRLCFVAVSRARKKCILIRSHQLPNKYGKWFPKDPSPFWIALKEFQENRKK